MTLTREQQIKGIEQMKSQGADNTQIQEWLDSLKQTTDQRQPQQPQGILSRAIPTSGLPGEPKSVAALFPGEVVKTAYGAGKAVLEPISKVGEGVLKGVASTAFGALSLGEQAGAALTGTKAPLGKALTGVEEPWGTQIKKEFFAAEGTAEKVGFGAEQFGELFLGAPVKKLAVSLGSKLGPMWGVAGRIIGSGVDYASKRAAQRATYEKLSDDTLSGMAGEAISMLGEKALAPLAERFYRSALKPPSSLPPKKAAEVVQTGLNERIMLFKGADDVVHAKLDALDDSLTAAIQNAENSGKMVKTEEMVPLLDSAKKFFGNQVDVKASEAATKELDDMYVAFTEKYGTELPPTVAQDLKRGTMSIIRG